MLLGTGGLSRAYADAARAALDEVGTVERVLQDLCEVSVDIAAVGRLEHALRSRGARVLGVEYTGEASLRFAVPPVARPRGRGDRRRADRRARPSCGVIGQEWVTPGR